MKNLDVKTRRTNERGIGWVPVFILILILVLLAFGGYIWVERRLGPIEDKLNTLSKQSSAAPATQTTSLPTTDNDRTTYTSAKGDVVDVDAPLKNASVESPLSVRGEVPGNWFSEGEFSLSLKNAKGDVITKGSAKTTENWQTTEQVDFSATLTWDKAVSGEGSLVLEKLNPSGMAENDDSVTIPVKL